MNSSITLDLRELVSTSTLQYCGTVVAFSLEGLPHYRVQNQSAVNIASHFIGELVELNQVLYS